MMNSAGDGLPLLVIQNRLRIELLFGERKNFAGDEFPMATLLGIALLDSIGDNLPESTGDNSSESTRDEFFQTPLWIKFLKLHWG